MSNVAFLWIFSRGIELGVIVLCLLPLRAFLRRKVPRLFSYLLWAALPVNVVYNLVMRFVPEMSRWVHSHLYQGMPIEIYGKNVEILKEIWTIGLAFFALFILFSYVRFQRCLVGSIRLEKNIYITSRISSPFSMGLFCPKIFLPTSIREEYYEPIILHEQIHIQRKDIWIKNIAIAFLAVFWFQPVLWYAYHLFINDMEEACDEAVLRKKGKDFSKAYAKALVEVSYQAGKVRGVAIGYGNGEIRNRIDNVMGYRKVGFFLCVMAVVVCILFMAVAIPISWQIPRMVQTDYKREVELKPSVAIEGTGMENGFTTKDK